MAKGILLNRGDAVELRENGKDRTGGFFTGIVTGFERDGRVAIITPDHTVMRDYLPNGFPIGAAHWGTRVILRPEQPGSISDAISRDEARNMQAAHAEGLHDEFAREGCPDCEHRSLQSYPE